MTRRNGTDPRIHFAAISDSGRHSMAASAEDLIPDDTAAVGWLAKHKAGVIAAVVAALFGSGGYLARLATAEDQAKDNAKAIEHHDDRIGAVEVRVTAMETAVRDIDTNVGEIKDYIEEQAEKREQAQAERIKDLEAELRRRRR